MPPSFDGKLSDFEATRPSPIQLVNGMLLLCSAWCVDYKMLLRRGRCVIRVWVDMKSVQGNAVKSVTRIIKDSGGNELIRLIGSY